MWKNLYWWILKPLVASKVSSSKSVNHQYSGLILKSPHIWNDLKDTVYDFEHFSETTYLGTGSLRVFCLVGFGRRDTKIMYPDPSFIQQITNG